MPFLKRIVKEAPPTVVRLRKVQKCGQRHMVYWVNGDHYRGEWLHDKKHGKGTNVWKKAGIVYDGDWQCGKRDGFGTMCKMDPASKEYTRVYTGGWKNDMMHGSGAFFYGDSAYYEGEWCENQRSGWGRMYYENGDMYEGEWLHDVPHGQGMLLLANDNRYEGGWKEGKKHGPGKFYFLDKGQLYEGMWIKGIAKCGIVTDFRREEASSPTMYPLPKVHLQSPEWVLMEAQSAISTE
ncbi:MORN repeat-containing protein 3 [Arapaima gigas]